MFLSDLFIFITEDKHATFVEDNKVYADSKDIQTLFEILATKSGIVLVDLRKIK